MQKQINALLQLAEPLGILQPGNQVKLQRSCAARSCVRGCPGVSIIDVIASTRMCCTGIIATAATCWGFDERIMNLKMVTGKCKSGQRETCVCVYVCDFDVF